MSRDKQVNTRVTPELYGRLEQACVEIGETKSMFIRTSISERLVRTLKQTHRKDSNRIKKD
jgi:predicted DNA-binding protein